MTRPHLELLHDVIEGVVEPAATQVDATGTSPARR